MGWEKVLVLAACVAVLIPGFALLLFFGLVGLFERRGAADDVVVLPRAEGEMVRGLRLNVSKLQGDVNRRQVYIAGLVAANERLKAHVARQRPYTDALKVAAREMADAVERCEDPLELVPPCHRLRDALGGNAAQTDVSELREFAEWLASMDDPENEQALEERRRVTMTAIIARAEHALAAARAGDDDGVPW